MTNILRIKRRTGGAVGAPSALSASELAYNEVDDTLWYGKGNSSGNATSIVKAGGIGNFLPIIGGTLSGNLTVNSQLVTVGADATTYPAFSVNGAAGSSRIIAIKTASKNRWIIYGNAVAEGGSNAGTDLYIDRYADDGTTTLGVPFTITRASGLTTLSSLSVTGNTTFTGLLTVNNGIVVPVSNANLELGSISAANTPFIDFHSSGTSNDYDVRLIANGGTSGQIGRGTLTVTATTLNCPATTYIGNASSSPNFILNGPAAADRNFWFQTNGLARWIFSANSGAESGSNAGTDLNILRYNDAGAFLGNPFSIIRSTGAVQITNGLSVTGGIGGPTALTTVQLTNAGTNGCVVLMAGNGTTTPNKYIRVLNGIFDIINSSFTAAILSLSDAGTIQGSYDSNCIGLMDNTGAYNLSFGYGNVGSGTNLPSIRTNKGASVTIVAHSVNCYNYGYQGGMGGPTTVALVGYTFANAGYGIYCDYTSDERIKKNIQPTEIDALAKLLQIPVTQFDIKAEFVAALHPGSIEEKPIIFERGDVHQDIGIVAQQLQKIIPDAVGSFPQSEKRDPIIPEDILNINSKALHPYYVRAIQQLAKRLSALEK